MLTEYFTKALAIALLLGGVNMYTYCTGSIEDFLQNELYSNCITAAKC